jgi:hypothetical protein
MGRDTMQDQELAHPDGDEMDVSIETAGDAWRSFLHLPAAIADEVRVHAMDDGLEVCTVDHANVSFIDLRWPEAGMDALSVTDGTLLALDVDRAQRAASVARKGNRGQKGDPVRLGYRPDDRCFQTTVQRDQLIHNVRHYAPKPGSLRAEPEMPDISDAMTTQARVDVNPLEVAIKNIGTDAVRLKADNGDLVMASHSLDNDVKISEWEGRFDGAANPYHQAEGLDSHDAEGSIIHTDYLSAVIGALSDAKFDRVTAVFGTEYPVSFNATHGDFAFDVQFMIAPRVER